MGVHHEPQFPLRRVFGPPGSSYFQSSLPVFKSSAARKARSPGPKFKMIFPRAGIYRIWVQSQRKGVVNTVAFNVPVASH